MDNAPEGVGVIEQEREKEEMKERKTRKCHVAQNHRSQWVNSSQSAANPHESVNKHRGSDAGADGMIWGLEAEQSTGTPESEDCLKAKKKVDDEAEKCNTVSEKLWSYC